MGNFSSNSSACCIPLDDSFMVDDNTITTKRTFRKANKTDRKKLNKLFTTEERLAMRNDECAPDARKIDTEFSFSSISSKSSSVNGDPMSSRSKHNYHEMDETRNDIAECCNSTHKELRVDASNESADDILNEYYDDSDVQIRGRQGGGGRRE